MRPDERALLQERVRTLVLRHALEAALDRLGSAARAAGRDAGVEFRGLEGALLAAADGVADRAGVQKLAVLAAAEDAAATIRTAFDNARGRLGAAPPSGGALGDGEPQDDGLEGAEPEAAAAWALVA